jgi:hypothetical protein
MDEAEIAVNKRIKQLMGQTLDDKFKETWSTMTPADLERFVKHFAELLIRDCADTAYRGLTASHWDKATPLPSTSKRTMRLKNEPD